MLPVAAPPDPHMRRALSAYDDLTAHLLIARGITTAEEAQVFLDPSYDEHLHDPLQMCDMPEAAARLGRAILSGEPIAVWSDYDCDGIPGGVLLHDFLKKAGAHFENYIPHRHHEGYGVNESGIEKLATRGVRLVVTVDSGITDVAPIQRARDLGMEVIVTDHHLPGATLPNALVIDPKARASETYPFKELCGAGLAWKLVVATLAVTPSLREKVPVGWEKWLLDMAGLATIADMVPLIGENRVLARYGLRVMRKSPRIGLQKLCRTMRVDQSRITEDDVGFMIAPRINAASRMGDAIDAFTLFTTDDPDTADLLAKKLEKLNRARKAQAGATTRAVRETLAARTELRSVIALGDPSWRPSLLGLVANSIAEEYGRPVFLWGREGNNSIKGSCRAGVPFAHVVDLMAATPETFLEFGGHAASGGFTVADDAIFTLEERLAATYDALRATTPTEPTLLRAADAELPIDQASVPFLTRLEQLAPFGERNPKPLFLLRDLVLESVSRFGKGEEHVRVRLHAPQHQRTIEGISFFAKGRVATIADTAAPGNRLAVYAHLERDLFTRGQPVRLRITDLALL